MFLISIKFNLIPLHIVKNMIVTWLQGFGLLGLTNSFFFTSVINIVAASYATLDVRGLVLMCINKLLA